MLILCILLVSQHVINTISHIFCIFLHCLCFLFSRSNIQHSFCIIVAERKIQTYERSTLWRWRHENHEAQGQCNNHGKTNLNNLRQNQKISHMRNPNLGKFNSPRGTRDCHKCGRKGHYAKEFHASMSLQCTRSCSH